MPPALLTAATNSCIETEFIPALMTGCLMFNKSHKGVWSVLMLQISQNNTFASSLGFDEAKFELPRAKKSPRLLTLERSHDI